MRDKSNHEIDYIIEKTETLIPIEIKAQMTASKNLFDELFFWQSAASKEKIAFDQSFLIYAGQETQKRNYGTFLSWRDSNTSKDLIIPSKS